MTYRSHRATTAAGLAVLVALLASCGASDETSTSGEPAEADPAAAATTVEIAMEDIRFDQATLEVDLGDTVEFRFTNNGKIAHDAFIGDAAAQMDHDAEMAEMGDMDGHSMHDDDAVTVRPGTTGELSYTFDQPGTFEIGCHQPGHYAAGMKVVVTVG